MIGEDQIWIERENLVDQDCPAGSTLIIVTDDNGIQRSSQIFLDQEMDGPWLFREGRLFFPALEMPEVLEALNLIEAEGLFKKYFTVL